MREREGEEAKTKTEERETTRGRWQGPRSTSLALVELSPKRGLRFLSPRQRRPIESVKASDLLEGTEDEGIIDDGSGTMRGRWWWYKLKVK